MAKIKVGKLALELEIDVKDLLLMLKDIEIPAKTAASSISAESAQTIREIMDPSTQKKPEEKKPVEVVAAKEEAAEADEVVSEEELQVEDTSGAALEEQASGPVIETDDISVKDLTEKLQVKPSEVIKELMKKGQLATINQRISADIAKEIAAILGKTLIVKKADNVTAAGPEIKMDNLVYRPPIVAIMGHVDHGKTKLLDAIRKTRVAEGESGGITQHIGAYQVDVHGKKVTFLDTPGHEAFTSLRARGAKVTDVAIIVVAADDGVKPQTIEAIDHVKAAGVPIIVAINKIDKPDANPDRVKQQLSDKGLMPEEWGGQTVTVATSAIKGTGINDLLEMILLVAEVQELKADPHGTAVGVVIESRLDKSRGAVASILVKNGTLKVGDVFVSGAIFGKIRALFDDEGKRMNQAGPSTPAEVLGFTSVPKSGDMLQVMSSEKAARALAEKRQDAQVKVERGQVLSLEDFSEHVKQGERKDLGLVVKADVQGSLDAITQSIQSMVIGNIHINLIHSGVGMINESDVMLARASNAIVVGFRVGASVKAEGLAQDEGIEVRHYEIIYKLIDDVKLAMEGLLEPEYEEVSLGHAEVRNLFKFSKVGVIAGSFVTDGKLVRGVKMRIFRDDEKIYEGKLESLKRFKDDVKSVESNFECGIALQGYSNFKQGDIVEAFEIREKKRQK